MFDRGDYLTDCVVTTHGVGGAQAVIAAPGDGFQIVVFRHEIGPSPTLATDVDCDLRENGTGTILRGFRATTAFGPYESDQVIVCDNNTGLDVYMSEAGGVYVNLEYAIVPVDA